MRQSTRMGALPRTRRLGALAIAVLLASAGLGMSAMPEARAAVACSVTYTVRSQWDAGFTADVTINNLGDPLTSWDLTWTFPGNQQVTQGWNGTYSQTGRQVTVHNADWNGRLATGASTTTGFNASFSGTNGPPPDFAINNTPCNGSGPPPTPTVRSSVASVTVPEGGTGTFTLVLGSAPTANVTVTTSRTSGDTDLGVQSGASLVFTSANWSTPQTVTVAGAEDADTSNGTAVLTASATGYTSATVSASEVDNDASGGSPYDQRFLALYNKLKDPANGYFSPQGVPYHSVETLIVEAPDHGHQTTSEAFSYWLWLEAAYGKVTGDWTKFNSAWATTEKYIIPTHADQPTNSSYNPSKPATYAPELDTPDQYPSPLDSSVPVGQDPLAAELQSAYGTADIYGMHWLLDVDNKYGFGNTPGGGCETGPGASGPSYINTFQRGSQESVWETIPQPTCDKFTFGGPNGYLDLFVKDSSYAQQWKYTDAPDADARAVQAAYWALTWATQQGKADQVSATVAKAAQMGDYLRYSFFDKYFKKIGNCTSPTTCPAGTGRDSSHYLLGWYYAWGGASAGGSWAWRIGDGAAHFGYQNPLAAYALSNVTALKPKSPTAVGDWTTSLQREMEFYRWLQSSEGAIAGGATNSWGGHYGAPPAGSSTFYGMYYDWQPVYHDPPSNQWFGMQAWSMERVAEYYFVTGNGTAKAVLDKWVTWVMAHTTVNANGTYAIPSTLSWSGQPDTWNSSSPGSNAGLHVTVVDTTNDVGVTAALAKTLMFYGSKAGNTSASGLAKRLLDGMWANHQDSKGISVPETRTDYNRFDDPVSVPSSFNGTMPNGDVIRSGATFTSLRSWYKNDPAWSKVQSYLDGGSAPSFNYHRFWAQADIAIAMANYGQLFPG